MPYTSQAMMMTCVVHNNDLCATTGDEHIIIYIDTRNLRCVCSTKTCEVQNQQRMVIHPINFVKLWSTSWAYEMAALHTF